MRRLLRRPNKVGEEPTADAGNVCLVLAAQSGALTFDRLNTRYARSVLNYCYYRIDAWPEAEDAAQQIFTNAFAGLARFAVRPKEPAGSFRSRLFTIAHHEVANRKRGYARHHETPLIASAELSDPGPTEGNREGPLDLLKAHIQRTVGILTNAFTAANPTHIS